MNESEFSTFEVFPKMARLSRMMSITEKIDGTNACISITEYGDMFIGSRSRWITPEQDNYGFARWAVGNRNELLTLGVGRHFGEWWGAGIQRGYGMKEKRFSLFNAGRWIAREDNRVNEKQEVVPACCHVVPILAEGEFCTHAIKWTLDNLEKNGSSAAPGFIKPEGIIIYHVAANMAFKKTIEDDEVPKALAGKK
jgi:hypothetical protein